MKAHAFVVLSQLWEKCRFITKEKETGIFVIATLRPEVGFGFLHLKCLGHNKITDYAKIRNSVNLSQRKNVLVYMMEY